MKAERTSDGKKLMIDDRDLRNLMRNAYLFGANAGLAALKTNEDAWCTEREKVITEYISEFEEEGYSTYSADTGSHLCTPETCEVTAFEKAYLE